MTSDESKKLDLTSKRILIVDDNKHIRQIIKGVLLSFGTQSVLESENGPDGLKELQNNYLDLAIIDYKMVPLDGLEMLHMIRRASDSANPEIPVIMLTGHTDAKFVKQAIEAGANEVLAKPISASILYSRLYEIFHNPRPFVRNKDYIGPERRVGRRPTSLGLKD